MLPVSGNQRYIDRKHIGDGLCSDVYSAKDIVTDRTVALKITDPDFDRAPHRSIKEQKILKAIRDECLKSKHIEKERNHFILVLLDSFKHGDDSIMVSPYLPFDLEEVIKKYSKARFPSLDGNTGSDTMSSNEIKYRNRIPEKRAAQITYQIASGLKFLHSKGIIHRDIKASNIFFKTLDGPAIIGDLGIVWYPPNNFGEEEPKEKYVDVATGAYKAPELMFGIRSYSTAIDIWSFGVLMTMIYSDDGQPIFNTNESNSDISLIFSIFETLGTPTIESWPESSESSSFSSMNFSDYPAKDLKTLLPRLPNIVKDELLSKTLIYESGQRITAENITKLSYFDDIRDEELDFSFNESI